MRTGVLLLSLLCCSLSLSAQVRHEVEIPDIEGYKTLKCDFHIHTIFSDGSVLPAIRVDEAFSEGLDAIAITDHIEYRPHVKSGLLNADHNKSYELAKNSSKSRSGDVIVIKGCEVTRDMPPGHWNAIFIEDANPIDTPEWRDAIKEAADQKAFLTWNHPGWERQAPDTTIWYDEHTELYDKGYMMGIEVANSNHYFPEAQQWAMDKNLTMLGNTDIHTTAGLAVDFPAGDHRTMTLVFAKERTAAGIREALENQRTAVYYRNTIMGREPLLRALQEACLKVKGIKRTANNIQIVLENVSGVELILSKGKHDMNLNYIRDIVIRPHMTYSFNVTFKKPTTEAVDVDLTIDNFYVASYEGLDFKISVPAFEKK